MVASTHGEPGDEDDDDDDSLPLCPLVQDEDDDALDVVEDLTVRPPLPHSHTNIVPFSSSTSSGATFSVCLDA